MKINEVTLNENMRRLGHMEHLAGTEYLREGVRMYHRGIGMTKELYPGIAKAFDTTPSRVERAMRHSIERAWERGDYDTQLSMFGYTVNPATGQPTVGEWVATMAKLCRDSADEN